MSFYQYDMYASARNDTLLAFPGSLIDGGAGIDELILPGSFEDYKLAPAGLTLGFHDRERGYNVETLDIELFRFLGDPGKADDVVYAYSRADGLLVPIIGEGDPYLLVGYPAFPGVDFNPGIYMPIMF